MPDVPEFLLRKLYVTGSFKKLDSGFSFELNNSLMLVTVAEMKILTNGIAVAPEDLFLQFQGQAEKPAAAVSQENPFLFSLAAPLTVRVNAVDSPIQTLTIEARTLEMGKLNFTIDLRPKKHNPVIEGVKSVLSSLRAAARVYKVARDPHHPIYHFTPPANWMNDPNGLVSWQGQTHLFYQYNPTAPVWGTIHWGHAVSTDLVHWKRLPIALSPEAGRPNHDGCWSGSAYITDAGPVFVYTAVFPETVCMVKPDAAFRKLEPVGENPLISQLPNGMNFEGFRDPNIWKEGDKYLLSLGSGIKGKGGAVLLFESEDMRRWHYLHPLLLGDSPQAEAFSTGAMWECPQLFEIDGEYFLFISSIIGPGQQYTFYFQGDYVDRRFIPRSRQFFDFSKNGFYAPLSFLDDQSRRIMFGWLVEERQDAANKQAGWAGALSLPRWLRLDPNRNLLVDPAPELDCLRKRQILSYTGDLTGEVQNLSKGHSVLNIDLQATLSSEANGKVSLLLAETPEAIEKTSIEYDFATGTLRVDTRASSSNPLCQGGLKEAPLQLQKGEALELRIFVDGSVLEVYANHRVVISSRSYPSNITKNALFIAGSSQTVTVHSMKAWQMANCLV